MKMFWSQIMAVIPTRQTAANAFEKHQLKSTEDWLHRWRVKPIANKSSHKGTTLFYHTTIVQNILIFILFEGWLRKLTAQRSSIKVKREELITSVKNLYCLLGISTSLSLANKTLIIQKSPSNLFTNLNDVFSNSNLKILQRAQSNILRAISKHMAFRFSMAYEIHEHLVIPTVREELRQ